MLEIVTPTRKLVNWQLYGSRKKKEYRTDADADRLAKSAIIRENGGFKVTALVKQGFGSLPIEKPALQIIFETASPQEQEVFKRYNDLFNGAEALRLSKIDLNRELESWLGNIDSVASRKAYRNGAKKFIRYCEERGLNPMMVSGKEIRDFRNILETSGASNPVIRATLIACRMLFDRIFESHDLRRRNYFRIKDLLPPKKRVKKLWVPDQAEIDKLLGFAGKNLVVFTAISLIIKFGMRIGAFEKMSVAGDRAVTVTKGKGKVYRFAVEDLNLWKTCPLNKFIT